MASVAEGRAHVVLVAGLGAAPQPESVVTASLPHPRSNEIVSYLIIDGTPHELHKSAEGSEGSWLLAHANSAQEDGSLIFASPIDPTFFVLARLFAARAERAAAGAASGRRSAESSDKKPLYEPLSDVLTVLACPGLGAISHAPNIAARLAAACDVNTKYDEPLVRLDEARALRWLRAKVAQIQRRRPPLLARAQASAHVVCAGTLDESPPAAFAPALSAVGCGQGRAGDDAENAETSEAAALARREAAIASRPEVGALEALSLLSDYLNDELLALVAPSYGFTVAQVRAEAAEPAAPAPRALMPRAHAHNGHGNDGAVDSDIADAEAAAAAACREQADEASAAGAGSARPLNNKAQGGGFAGGPAAKKARPAPAIAKLAKTDVRRMQPLTSFFSKKPS